MNKYFDSPEVDKMRKRIADKKAYLPKIENKYAYQMLNAEIMEMENLYLPALLNSTSVLFSEYVRYFIKSIDAAIKFNCNSLLVSIPLNENYINSPIIGISNSKQLQRYGTPGAMEISVINMDGNGAKFSPININLDTIL